MKIYTRRGDDGTTALRVGGRVRKDTLAIEVNGAVDEAQAALGLARARCRSESEVEATLTQIERDLWILMAEVATDPARRERLEPDVTAVSAAMVGALEASIDDYASRFSVASSFAVPGQDEASAALDFARTIVRRAERLAVALDLPASLVVTYLNRCSDLCWTLARLVEVDHHHQQRRATR